MTLGLSLAAIVIAFAFVWRGFDVRFVLLATAMAIGAVAGQPGVVFRKTAEALADGKFLLPICSAMGFAYAARATGCVAALVELLLRPVARVPRLVVPGAAAVALVVNMALPSQTSTLATVGPLSVALMAKLGTSAALAGAALVFGASIAGSLINPGLAEVAALASATGEPAAHLVLRLAPGVLLTFLVGILALGLLRRLGVGRTDTPLVPTLPTDAEPASARTRWKALLPPLPVVVLLLMHPSLPTAALASRVIPKGLEVFTVMLGATVLTVAVAARDRAAATRAVLDGMGYAFAHIITIIAVSSGVAKALEVSGLLGAFIDLTSGNAGATFAAAFAMAFGLAILSGSGSAPSVLLITALGPRAVELGVSALALGGVILFGAEAGRTTSPVAAVLLFGGQLARVPPRTLTVRLILPCLVAGGAGALYCVLALST